MIENPSAISDNMSALKRIRDVRLGLQQTMLNNFNANSKSKYNSQDNNIIMYNNSTFVIENEREPMNDNEITNKSDQVNLKMRDLNQSN